jgi:hypothetical protein
LFQTLKGEYAYPRATMGYLSLAGLVAVPVMESQGAVGFVALIPVGIRSFTLQKTFLKKRLDQYAKILTMPEQKIIISIILEI